MRFVTGLLHVLFPHLLPSKMVGLTAFYMGHVLVAVLLSDGKDELRCELSCWVSRGVRSKI